MAAYVGGVEPEPNDDRAVMLASFVASGDVRGVRRVIEADRGAVNELGLDGTSPLCAAAMWGHIEILRLLLEAMASPGVRNDNGPRWTPLHAAALQEEGKACMLLLDFKASPQERDVEGVSPCDYASVSEAVWPLFAARGCERVPKAVLVERGVLRKASGALELELRESAPAEEPATAAAGRRGLVPEYSRPGSAYVVSREYPPRPGSAAARTCSRPGSSRKAARPIDILEEEDEGQAEPLTAGLRSLGI
mmetsp:Transcript_140569/g.437152  ORF Transcript_140569/g.437152 Transcript_140569/m.437152 type:complete len:250 (-) Transcript_140569:338-1087(-)